MTSYFPRINNNNFPTYKSISESPIFKPRLYQARLHFLEQYRAYGFLDLNELISYYLDWVSLDEYFILWKKIYSIGVYIKIPYAVKCSKRGNDVYAYRVWQKLSLLYEGLERYEPNDSCYVLRSDILFFTLTYENRNLFEVYENVGRDFNRFMSNLRKIFPEAKCLIRCFEAQKDGVVHIHALIYIKQHIDIKPYFMKKGKDEGKQRYIIANKDLWDMIKKCWKYGYADVQAFLKLRDGLEYIFKYIYKAIELEPENKSLLTLSLNWLFGKRSFSINYKCLRTLFNLRLDRHKHNSNSRTILQCINLVIEHEFVGVFSKKQLGLDGDNWFYTFETFDDKLLNALFGEWETPF